MTGFAHTTDNGWHPRRRSRSSTRSTGTGIMIQRKVLSCRAEGSSSTGQRVQSRAVQGLWCRGLVVAESDKEPRVIVDSPSWLNNGWISWSGRGKIGQNPLTSYYLGRHLLYSHSTDPRNFRLSGRNGQDCSYRGSWLGGPEPRWVRSENMYSVVWVVGGDDVSII